MSRVEEIKKELERLNGVLTDATKRIDQEIIQVTLDKMTALNKEMAEIEKEERAIKIVPAKNAPIGNSNLIPSRNKVKKEFNISEYNNMSKIHI